MTTWVSYLYPNFYSACNVVAHLVELLMAPKSGAINSSTKWASNVATFTQMRRNLGWKVYRRLIPFVVMVCIKLMRKFHSKMVVF